MCVQEFEEGLQGFTQHQRDILDQQLRMHVQFATQNFLQVYGNPGNNLWKQATKFKSFLVSVHYQLNVTFSSIFFFLMSILIPHDLIRLN